MIVIGAGQKNLSTYPINLSKIFKTMPPPNRLPQGSIIVYICISMYNGTLKLKLQTSNLKLKTLNLVCSVYRGALKIKT